MSRVDRILIALSSLILALTYFFPLWKISLWAPQYPEGLSLHIWTSKLTGDIQTINILNHYIGMAHIDAASFNELKYFPIVFGVLIGLGLLSSILNKRYLLYGWTLTLVVFSVIALYDFWAWEYRFGHELNPDAAIKMEDMVYQPPLFGEKVFLNIVATAYPGLAGWAMMITVIAALLVSTKTFRSHRKGDIAQ
jgi:copper chaperone NosL